MFLCRLKLLNFKNYKLTDLSFSTKVVCFTGENGAGKTNLLDSIYYLCLTKSYFNPVDFQNIRHNEDFFRIDGEISHGDLKTDLSCVVQKGKRKIMSKNSIVYQKMAEHVGQFPVVIITPDDNELISGGGEVRRRFMDNILSQYSIEYLEHSLTYNKVLSQRNAALKKFAERKSADKGLLK
ncbi:MAG TPA: AAA family ATPase, partial [Flavobacterium sp.]|nr:AAA family ATPase [Flavobacterium sp.]